MTHNSRKHLESLVASTRTPPSLISHRSPITSQHTSAHWISPNMTGCETYFVAQLYMATCELNSEATGDLLERYYDRKLRDHLSTQNFETMPRVYTILKSVRLATRLEASVAVSAFIICSGLCACTGML